MKITQDVRDYAATLNEKDKGGEMSEEFRQMGSEVYVEKEAVKESNRCVNERQFAPKGWQPLRLREGQLIF